MSSFSSSTTSHHRHQQQPPPTNSHLSMFRRQHAREFYQDVSSNTSDGMVSPMSHSSDLDEEGGISDQHSVSDVVLNHHHHRHYEDDLEEDDDDDEEYHDGLDENDQVDSSSSPIVNNNNHHINTSMSRISSKTDDDDEIDVDPEKFMRDQKSTRILQDNDSLTISSTNDDTETAPPSKRKTSSAVVVDDTVLGTTTPFFQEHIYYDEDEKEPIEKVSKCCSCICESLPRGMRSRMEYCGKKLCAPRILVSFSMLVFSLSVSIMLLLSCGVFIGMKLIDYPKMQLDPNSISFIHRNCCMLERVFEDFSQKEIIHYEMTVKFPVLGFENMSSEESAQRGYNLKCELNSHSVLRVMEHVRYSGPRIALFYNHSIVDCFTNRKETEMTLLEPYSAMYQVFQTVGIYCGVMALSMFCIGFCGFVTCCFVLRKKRRKKSNPSTFRQCCCFCQK
ncbi:hypothetical protein FDP41_012081 [Naegleria fowleri]|uniref:Uncharacterized protein n=1 Tax=Naegleria fowleri TaxID=5763 RepID=A0A6A5C4N7_NAEFO|nr:uncharacterized protein FDP41_012081 [Naegleria fowleri]KAF0981424.1 hypothetical protein FDP41_012081 [Naegleria fowleri]